MKAMMLRVLAVVVVLTPAVVFSQGAKSKPTTATYITKEEIIPAGAAHGWVDIPEHVDYLSFRPSPGILTAGYVHPVLKK